MKTSGHSLRTTRGVPFTFQADDGAGLRNQWPGVLTHTHLLKGELLPPENYRNLATWASDRGLGAIGVGSPFLPETAEAYRRYEDRERDVYYRGGVDYEALTQRDKVRALMDELNRLSGDVCFYLDNETPKARFGHMWWIGWHHDFPEWHDYDQPFDRWMCREQQADDVNPEPMRYERRPYMQILHEQRARDALGIWAHPTSWWTTDRGAFVTNIASEMPAHLAAEGRIDGLVVMGYDAYRPSYLDLWFSLLNAGYPVTAFAETDIDLSTRRLWDLEELYLTHVPSAEGKLDLGGIRLNAMAGCGYVSSGPFLTLRVDGQPMGSVIRSEPGSMHSVEVTVAPAEGEHLLSRVEVVSRQGRVEWSLNQAEAGTYRFELEGNTERGYLVCQAFGRNDHPERTPAAAIRHYAVTNPVYMKARGENFPAPLATNLRLTCPADSGFAGGSLRILHHDRDETLRLHAGMLELEIPTASLLHLKRPDGTECVLDLVESNPRARKLQQYLYRGRFLADYEGLEPGQVPAEAFQVDAFREALGEHDITLGA